MASCPVGRRNRLTRRVETLSRGSPSTTNSASGSSFTHVKTVDRPSRLADADQVDRVTRPGNHHHGQTETPGAGGGCDLSQVVDQEVQVGGDRRDADPEREPAGLEARERTESDLRIDIGTSGAAEAAGDLGETEDHRENAEAREEKSHGAPGPRQTREDRGVAEDGAADDAVDDRSGRSHDDGADEPGPESEARALGGALNARGL